MTKTRRVYCPPTMSQERYLVLNFWRSFRKCSDKLSLLRYFSRLRWHRRFGWASRAEFEKSGIEWRQRCAVCRNKAHHRHHIIQLQYGGRNIPQNIISLCRDCHKKIHIQHKPVVIKPLARVFNGKPRLVKKACISPPTDAESFPLPNVSGPEPEPALIGNP